MSTPNFFSIGNKFRTYLISIHIGLIIWVCLTYVQGDNAIHWIQTGLIFFNLILIALNINGMYHK